MRTNQRCWAATGLLAFACSVGCRADDAAVLGDLGRTIGESSVLADGNDEPVRNTYATSAVAAAAGGSGFGFADAARERNQQLIDRMRQQQADVQSRLSYQQVRLAEMRSRLSEQQTRLSDMRSRMSEQRSKLMDQSLRIDEMRWRTWEVSQQSQKAIANWKDSLGPGWVLTERVKSMGRDLGREVGKGVAGEHGPEWMGKTVRMMKGIDGPLIKGWETNDRFQKLMSRSFQVLFPKMESRSSTYQVINGAQKWNTPSPPPR